MAFEELAQNEALRTAVDSAELLSFMAAMAARKARPFAL